MIDRLQHIIKQRAMEQSRTRPKNSAALDKTTQRHLTSTFLCEFGETDNKHTAGDAREAVTARNALRPIRHCTKKHA